MRRCPSCGKFLPEAEFRADGKSQKCTSCRKATRAMHIKNHFRRMTPDQRQTITQRRRAQNYGVPHEEYSRTAILARWSYICAYCPALAEHLDHVHPLSKGGADAEHNIVPACAPCNLSKGAKTLAEWAATFGPEPPPFDPTESAHAD